MASPFLGQVSDPGSPFFGCVYKRHCNLPVSGSIDSRNPGISVTSPETPTITWSRTTSGAMVAK